MCKTDSLCSPGTYGRGGGGGGCIGEGRRKDFGEHLCGVFRLSIHSLDVVVVIGHIMYCADYTHRYLVARAPL